MSCGDPYYTQWTVDKCDGFLMSENCRTSRQIVGGGGVIPEHSLLKWDNGVLVPVTSETDTVSAITECELDVTAGDEEHSVFVQGKFNYFMLTLPVPPTEAVFHAIRANSLDQGICFAIKGGHASV